MVGWCTGPARGPRGGAGSGRVRRRESEVPHPRRLTALLLAAIGVPAVAHDFWILPDSFTPQPGGVVRVGLRVGDDFPGEPVPRNAARIIRFVAAGPAGEVDVLGADGRDPAGLVKPTRAGTYVLGYRSNHAFVELPAEKFEAYLQSEGLQQIVALRRERDQSAAPGREVYSRCAKAIIHVGALAQPATPGAPRDAAATAPAASDASADAGFNRPLGFTLELIPELDPAALRPGDSLPLRLLFNGRPLAGALVDAATPGDPDGGATARTDPDGRLRLALRRPGLWKIAAVHMTEAPAGADADWESFWATLTFEIGRPTASPGEPPR